MTDACYLPLDSAEDAGADRAGDMEYFAPTEHALGPWGPIQHGGPVSGLLTRAMDRCAPRAGARLTKISVDLLGPVPMSEVRVGARVTRPGKRIEMLSAVLEARQPDGSWRAAATASAWRLANQPTDDVVRRADPPVELPDEALDLSAVDVSSAWSTQGFVNAMEWRLGTPGGEPGDPTVAWVRLRLPLVAGEEISDLERLMTVADAANGVGARLDPAEFAFLNTDLTVHLFEEPGSQWVGIAAEASVGSDGVGMNAGVLHAPHGPIGRLAQNLLVERRVPATV